MHYYGNRLPLCEDVIRGSAALRVDRDKGIIHGVKILGLESVNGRRYTPEAVQAARSLYEGLPVYTNHPLRPNDPRPVRDKFGRLLNVHIEPDGLYGDLEYLKSHEDAALIVEAAERMPEQFGLSHNAQGEGEDDQDGIFIVRKIVDVRSVDVVTEPATTAGLFEHYQRRGRRPSLHTPEGALLCLLEGRPVAAPRRGQKRSVRSLRRKKASRPEDAMRLLLSGR